MLELLATSIARGYTLRHVKFFRAIFQESFDPLQGLQEKNKIKVRISVEKGIRCARQVGNQGKGNCKAGRRETRSRKDNNKATSSLGTHGLRHLFLSSALRYCR